MVFNVNRNQHTCDRVTDILAMGVTNIRAIGVFLPLGAAK